MTNKTRAQVRAENNLFARLRDYLSGWAATKLKRPTASAIDDLVHDTIERILRSDTAANIEMTESELRGFAWTTMDRLVKDRRRNLVRANRALSGYADLCMSHDNEGPPRQMEIEEVFGSLTPRELRVLDVIVKSGEDSTRVIKETPGIWPRDAARLRKKIRRELAR
jgi:DNA-directed RNA polymerase specialized sigma24 family protein